MNLKNSYPFIMIGLTLAVGLLGTYFFATWNTLSRELKDVTSMLVLITSLIIAGILIVRILSKMPPVDPPKS